MHKNNTAAALALFLLLAFLRTSSAAIVQGTVYDAGTLDVVDKAIITASTLPEQVRVSDNGSYSFEIPDGNYTITARKFDNGTLSLVASQDLVLSDNGTYAVDLLLLPPSEFFDMEANHTLNPLEDENLTQIENLTLPPEQSEPASATANVSSGTLTGTVSAAPVQFSLLQTALGVAVIMALGYLLITKFGKQGRLQPGIDAAKRVAPAFRHSVKIAQKTAKIETLYLSPEQKQAVGILKKAGGHMTQKELRKGMPCSEAKVSLVVTELEEMKVVKKFKRGRGNIIKLLK